MLHLSNVEVEVEFVDLLIALLPLAALDVLCRISSDDASLVESVLLFTDGKANVGIKDQAALEKATRWVCLPTLTSALYTLAISYSFARL